MGELGTSSESNMVTRRRATEANQRSTVSERCCLLSNDLCRLLFRRCIWGLFYP